MKFTHVNKLAEYVISEYLNNGKKPEINSKDIDVKFTVNAASFVTVYVRGQLRGCIGNVEANGPLYKSVVDNAVSAVSEDYRFVPLTISDLPDLTVEVTILSSLHELKPKTNTELLNYLKLNKPGLMLIKGNKRAVFLPQVWEQLPNPIIFLEELCQKAELDIDAWKNEMKFQIFTKLSETEL
jgi:uncharacterized protein